MSQRTTQTSCAPFFALLAFSFLVVTGCNKKDADPNPTSDSDVSSVNDLPDSRTTSVAATKSTNLTSPAVSANTMPPPEAPPEAVCQQFMKLLQSGNRIQAENLFTMSALTTTTKAGLKLEPMGGPTSTFRIGDVRYATNRKRLAQVDCIISDKDENGNSVEVEVTWQLHKLSKGFRISGVMLQLDDGKAKDLLSLENAYDVAKLQSLAGADVLDTPEPRQAKAKVSTVNK